MNLTKQIILPNDENKKDYVLFLYKNRNNYHNMNDKHLNNLIKLMSNGKLDDTDYPIFKKKNVSNIEGFTI